MLQRKNKKGFTLAELLIVVAIIAVLVAIAVPLFVGALDSAKENVANANIRAVRGEAVAKILLNQDNEAYSGKLTDGAALYATAQVTADGEVTGLEISETAPTSEAANTAKPKIDDGKTGKAIDDGKGGYYVSVKITVSDLNME